MRALLTLTEAGNQKETLLELRDQPRTTLGTSIECDFVIDKSLYPSISRIHIIIERHSDQDGVSYWTLQDNQSTNGTFVNGSRLLVRHTLVEGDQISLARSTLELVFHAPVQELHAIETAKQSNVQAFNEVKEAIRSESQASPSETEATINRISEPVKSSRPGSLERRRENQQRRVMIASDTNLVGSFLNKSDVKALAVDRARTRFVFYSEDRSLSVTTLDSGSIINTVAINDQAVTALRFSKDSRYLAFAKKNKEICIWDSNLTQELAVLRGHRMTINDLAFSPDSKLIASSSLDKTVRVWDVESNQERHRIPRDGLGSSAIDFGSDGETLAMGGRDRFVQIWNLKAQAFDPIKYAFTSGIERVCMPTKNSILVTVTSDRLLHTRMLSSPIEDTYSAKITDQRSIISLSNCGDLIAIAGPSDSIKAYSLNRAL